MLLTQGLLFDLALDLALTVPIRYAYLASHLEQVALSFALPDERAVVCDSGLQHSLQQLKEQLPSPSKAEKG